MFVAYLPLEQVKRRIANWVERLSPAFSLVVFALPMGLLLPFKLAALWLIARGYWLGGVSTLIFAKMLGISSTAFVYEAARTKLLQLAWFRSLHDLLRLARLVARDGRSCDPCDQSEVGAFHPTPHRPRGTAHATHPNARAYPDKNRGKSRGCVRRLFAGGTSRQSFPRSFLAPAFGPHRVPPLLGGPKLDTLSHHYS
jgi:hypothetical protein